LSTPIGCHVFECSNPGFSIVYPDGKKNPALGIILCYPCREAVVDSKAPRQELHRAAAMYVRSSLGG